MIYETLAIFWLLCMFFGCCGLYCFVVSCPILHKSTQKPCLGAVVSSGGHCEPPPLVFDFANREYAELWFHQFTTLNIEPKILYGYNGDSVVACLNNYLGLAFKHDFAIPGKECIAWWRDMIKKCKPASPSRPLYYAHITAPTKPLTNAQLRHKPPCNSYGGNGYGFEGIGKLGKPLCGDWVDKHLVAYGDGVLPEQTMEIVRV